MGANKINPSPKNKSPVRAAPSLYRLEHTVLRDLHYASKDLDTPAASNLIRIRPHHTLHGRRSQGCRAFLSYTHNRPLYTSTHTITSQQQTRELQIVVIFLRTFFLPFCAVFFGGGVDIKSSKMLVGTTRIR